MSLLLTVNTEVYTVSQNGLLMVGWAFSDGQVEISVYDKKNNRLDTAVDRHQRADVADKYGLSEDYQAGFRVELVCEDLKSLLPITVEFSDGHGQSERSVFDRAAYNAEVLGGGRGIRAFFYRGVRFFKKNGFKKTVKKTLGKLSGDERRDLSYDAWRRQRLLSEEELRLQRETHFEYEPLISLVVPLYRTQEVYLRELVDLIISQTYGNWELILADGSRSDQDDVSPMRQLLSDISGLDGRIHVTELERNAAISGNTNAAIELATGDYIAFMDHDDTLEADAFFECVRAINEHDRPELIYTDQDKIDEHSREYFEPFFKGDFSINMLRSMNYMCHLLVVSKSLLDRLFEKEGVLDSEGHREFLRAEFDGAQDYDFILRCVEEARGIYHIPRILYHWRTIVGSTADNPVAKKYAFAAGRRAIAEHYRRLGIDAEVTETEVHGVYRSQIALTGQPLVSILIPTCDHVDDLKLCVESLMDRLTYKNFEIILIENNSKDQATFDYYKKLEADYGDRIKTVYYEGGFNFSAINNFGEKTAAGEYVLLLNNDTEVMSPDLLEELLMYGQDPEVGAVGARLFYPDGDLQHAGIVMGIGGVAGHIHQRSDGEFTGYFNRIIAQQDISGVTAACMLVRRSVYELVGGLNEDLAVAFNDVDFCLRIRETGYRIVYNPYATMTHYESKSRGYEDDPEKISRFAGEITYMKNRWRGALENDPYYNVNLTLKDVNSGLKKEETA
ncbi:MAG: glycosyltransferase family 2 protein [Lachnospiraceae bacterium]|nr:glycosyltransferase family 2 protein [Lachnospiraceae bacterium]